MTNKKLFKSAITVLGFALLTISITIGLNAFFGSQHTKKDVVENLAPVGKVNLIGQIADVVIPTANADDGAGKATYEASCMFCHGAGAAGAPKLTDAEAWKDRIAKGIEALNASAINGINAMPAKGGNAALTDDQIKETVQYMVDTVSGS